jgi:hypothetical protein
MAAVRKDEITSREMGLKLSLCINTSSYQI